MPKNNSGHFGIDAPQYVYGKKNLDFVPGLSVQRASQPAGASLEHAKNDFRDHDFYGDREDGTEISIYDAVNNPETLLRDIDFKDVHGDESEGVTYTSIYNGEALKTQMWKDDDDNIMSLSTFPGFNPLKETKEILGYSDDHEMDDRLREANLWYMYNVEEKGNALSEENNLGTDFFLDKIENDHVEPRITSYIPEEHTWDADLTISDVTHRNIQTYELFTERERKSLADSLKEHMDQWDEDN